MKTMDKIALTGFVVGAGMFAVPFVSSSEYVRDNLTYVQVCAAFGPALVGLSAIMAQASWMERTLSRSKQNKLNTKEYSSEDYKI